MIKSAALLCAGIIVATTSSAFAVSGVGNAIRVDTDPGTSTYQFGIFNVNRTPAGGFAVGWEEDSDAATGIEKLRYRIFKPGGAPVAAVGTADFSGHTAPAFARIIPLGTGYVYFTYTASLPSPGKREAFGQAITVTTGVAAGARRLLNISNNAGQVTLRVANASDGRALAAWYDGSNYATIRGRFTNATGVPQVANLQFACCQSPLANLDPLGTGFLATYRRVSFSPNVNELYGRVFNSNGAPLAAPKKLPIASNDYSPGLRALSNGKILLFETVHSGSTNLLVGQLYTQAWQLSGGQKILNANTAATVAFSLAPTLDGGILFARNQHVGSTYSLIIQRFDAALNPVGAAYTIVTDNADSARMVVLSANRAVAVFHMAVAGRQALFARLLSF